MTENQNKLAKFWQELKRRKVIRVIIVYATTAFILLQLIDLLLVPLNLPDWVMTFFVVLLVVGFPIVVIFSWIFDITPQGVKVTKSGETKVEHESAGIFSKKYLIFDIIIGVLLIAVIILAYPKIFKREAGSDLEKTIIVLPFIDDSPEKDNTHIINGLMESINNNLCAISDLIVKSRTSAEKYRNNPKLASEIAKELNVNYIIEGSGQKIGDKIILTVQLIEAPADKHLWSHEYEKPANPEGFYAIRNEVAKAITNEIHAQITPEEKERIKKKLTSNQTALDYYLKGSELLNKSGQTNLENAIRYFEKALEYDDEFALAYANLALTYFFLDYSRDEQRYSTQINDNADKALLYDSQLDMSLTAKAAFYINQEELELAIPYLEKALQYNPNSYLAIRGLCTIYSWEILDKEKSMEYALKAIHLDIPTSDIFGKRLDYHLALSFVFQNSGFFKEADIYINKSFEIAPDNLSAIIEKGKLLIDMSNNYQKALELYTEAYLKDSADVSLIRTLFLTYCENRDFANAYKYGSKLIEMQEAQNRPISVDDSARFGVVLTKIGKGNESEEYFKRFRDDVEKSTSTYKDRQWAIVYSLEGDSESALEQMRIFSERNDYPYAMVRRFKVDLLYDNIRELPEFKEILAKIEDKFWANHDRIEANLTAKGLLPLKM